MARGGPQRHGGDYYMYHHVSTQQFYVLHTQCIDVFCVDLRTNSDYFPIQQGLGVTNNRDIHRTISTF